MHSQESGERLVDLLARYARVNADRTFLKGAGISLPRVTDATRHDADVLAASGRPHDVLRRTTHDEAVATLRALGTAWDVRDSASVWVAGLWAWRPALTGVLLARGLPEHESVPYRGPAVCRVCGTKPSPVLAQTEEWFRRRADRR
ncbi:hypothetical protein AB0383_12625 [Amycolatopsis sp. NPDC051373]|uniref:hypothetical protein n=1 Tax=Amycolatopsis sp. NPDC051373 TaxID=3155801 RepID=UPI00344F2F6A